MTQRYREAFKIHETLRAQNLVMFQCLLAVVMLVSTSLALPEMVETSSDMTQTPLAVARTRQTATCILQGMTGLGFVANGFFLSVYGSERWYVAEKCNPLSWLQRLLVLPATMYVFARCHVANDLSHGVGQAVAVMCAFGVAAGWFAERLPANVHRRRCVIIENISESSSPFCHAAYPTSTKERSALTTTSTEERSALTTKTSTEERSALIKTLGVTKRYDQPRTPRLHQRAREVGVDLMWCSVVGMVAAPLLVLIVSLCNAATSPTNVGPLCLLSSVLVPLAMMTAAWFVALFYRYGRVSYMLSELVYNVAVVVAVLSTTWPWWTIQE